MLLQKTGPPSAGLDPFQCVVTSLQCEVSLINWPFQLQPVFLPKPRPWLCIQPAPACCSPHVKSAQSFLAASEAAAPPLGYRNVSSAFLQCSCFLGFSQAWVGAACELHSWHSLSGLCAVIQSTFFFFLEKRVQRGQGG